MADPETIPEPVARLLHELGSIFGKRLQCVSMYGGNGEADRLTGAAAGQADDHIHTLVVVESIDAKDLRACAHLARSWHRRGLATPLLMPGSELTRSLDAFPLELGEILAHHTVVAGTDVLAGLSVAPADIRQACEVQARSHLLHLREGYIQAGAEPRALAAIIQASARPFRLLLVSMARLEGVDIPDAAGFAGHLEATVGLTPGVVRQVLAAGGTKGISATDAQDLYPAYLQAVERLVHYVDAW
ncbi:MAG: hypothetical protein NTV05_01285 [Acidobacteria bacterium]|nr:hypothetical protein [Acidobacteriota bacterium]